MNESDIYLVAVETADIYIQIHIDIIHELVIYQYSM